MTTSCQTPFTIQHLIHGSMPVPCGKCPNCISRRVSGWSFRLMQQEKVAETAHFVTLTYDNQHVPITSHKYMGLCKRDLQLFFKRLRKRQPDCRLKYYAVGEYGGQSFRPHYHIILFDAILENIQPSWELGDIHYGTITEASVGYCLKYLTKQSRIPLHRNDDRPKEFGLMSKGLGANYLTPQMVKWHKASLEDRMYCNIEDGKKSQCLVTLKTKSTLSKSEKELLSFHELLCSHERLN